MTLEQFVAKYRPRLLLLFADAWAMRKEPTQAVGLALDVHLQSIAQTLREMHGDLSPVQARPPAVQNGQHPQPAKRLP